MKLIKLTKKDDGHSIWINPAHVLWVFNKGPDHGGIEFVNMTRIEVAENAAAILKALCG